MAATAETTEGKSTAGTSMVAEHPRAGNLSPVETLAKASGIPDWERAAMMHAAGWKPGKSVDQETFDATLAKFRKRPMGGGRLKI